jgi:hypothetical protein
MRGAATLILLCLLRAVASGDEEADGEYHLRRAQQAIDLNAWSTAMQEFEAAANVMTPAEREYELARCWAHLGHEDLAIAGYEKLAVQSGPLAEAARARLAELDQLRYTREHPPRSIGPPLIAGVGSVLAAGVGAVLVGSGLAPLPGLNAIDCPSPCGTRRSLELRADIGYGFFALAGVTLAVDGFLWARWKKSRATPPARHY